jgi:heme/copper-type cytochrome/quinol oxidase subunit 3
MIVNEISLVIQNIISLVIFFLEIEIILCLSVENNIYFVNLRILQIHLFYNLLLFYWHLLEILWLFIFIVFYRISQDRKYEM